jgi:hypothetical protein
MEIRVKVTFQHWAGAQMLSAVVTTMFVFLLHPRPAQAAYHLFLSLCRLFGVALVCISLPKNAQSILPIPSMPCIPSVLRPTLPHIAFPERSSVSQGSRMDPWHLGCSGGGVRGPPDVSVLRAGQRRAGPEGHVILVSVL